MPFGVWGSTVTLGTDIPHGPVCIVRRYMYLGGDGKLYVGQNKLGDASAQFMIHTKHGVSL